MLAWVFAILKAIPAIKSLITGLIASWNQHKLDLQQAALHKGTQEAIGAKTDADRDKALDDLNSGSF